MSELQVLRDLGQSIWLDNITRDLLTSGDMQRYIDEMAVTGLTSNPTIFYKAINSSSVYDGAIRAGFKVRLTGESLFFRLAMDDIVAAADLFAPVYKRTDGVDGWVSLEVSPLLAHDAEQTVSEAERLYASAGRPNVFIKIPGTREGIVAIEEAIFRGVPINVTLLFSHEQYVAAAEAYHRGIERRIGAGHKPNVASVASVFISRWDVSVHDRVPIPLRNSLGIAVGRRCYRAYRELLASPRLARIMNEGARPQRLLFASTGTKDDSASDVLYIEGLAAPLTINTMPLSTILAFADHGCIAKHLPGNGEYDTGIIGSHQKAGIDVAELAEQLQEEGTDSFIESWSKLMSVIDAKCAGLRVSN